VLPQAGHAPDARVSGPARVWLTRRVILTEGRPREGRRAALFCRHLDDLRRLFRHYRVIHVVCDNANTPGAMLSGPL
jgi:hypothetical protein